MLLYQNNVYNITNESRNILLSTIPLPFTSAFSSLKVLIGVGEDFSVHLLVDVYTWSFLKSME